MSFHSPTSTLFMLASDPNDDPVAYRVLSPFDPVCELFIIVGTLDEWEFVQVTAADRCPTWDEMKWLKDCCWDAEDVCFQLHPAASRYINKSEFSLWIWRPTTTEIPQPPLHRESTPIN